MAKRRSRFRYPETCPVCGAEVPPDALACPECGADEKTGWKDEEWEAAAMDLPEEEFDYDRFIDEELGGAGGIKPRDLSWLWWGLALLVVMSLVAVIFWP